MPIHHPKKSLVAAVAALTILSGCGTSTTQPNTSAVTQDVADDLALQTSLHLRTIGVEVDAATTAMTGAPSPVQGTAMTRAAFDTTFVLNGITFEISRTFFGPGGELLQGYGPTAVRMVWTSRAYGSVMTARDTATIGHSGQLDVDGIHATRDTLTFVGLSLDTLTNTFRSFDGTRTRYVHATSNLVYQDVRLLKNRTLNPWPLSGTATYDLIVDRLRSNDVNDVESHLVARVVVTFNGTSMPDVVVSGRFHYKLNLLTGAVVRV